MSDSDDSPVPTKKRRLNRDSAPPARHAAERPSKVVLSSSQFDEDRYSDPDAPFATRNDAFRPPSARDRVQSKPIISAAKTKKQPSRQNDQALQELRRRNARQRDISPGSESPDERPTRPKHPRAKPSKPAREKQPKPKKPKHRIIVHDKTVAELEDMVATQLPDANLSSSPWRQRGAIIQKRPARDSSIESEEELYSWSPSQKPHDEAPTLPSSPPALIPPTLDLHRSGKDVAEEESEDHTGVGRGSRAQSMQRGRSKSSAVCDTESEDDAFSTFVSKSQRALRPNPSKANVRIKHPHAATEYGWERESASQKLKTQSQLATTAKEPEIEMARAAKSPSIFSDSMDDDFFDVDNDEDFASPPQPSVLTKSAKHDASFVSLDGKENSPGRLKIPSSPPGFLPPPPLSIPSSQIYIAQAPILRNEAANPPPTAFDIGQLEDLPSDAFDDDDNDEDFLQAVAQAESREVITLSSQVDESRAQRKVAPKKNLQQQTLFGDVARPGAAPGQAPRPSTQGRQLNFLVDRPLEPATHHQLSDDGSDKSWIFPTNLGAVRDYQYNIVGRGLFSNTLVALPTGLGKTFIAAAIMLNWYRWTKTAQIYFVAPTKPLVKQQVDACLGIAGIPRSDTTLLTGNVHAPLRREEYARKRVFFMTPQTLVNDIKQGNADPKRVVLLVVDEAHRATGAYAYVELVRIIRQFNKSFRVLALTATPGASVEKVQAVMDGLHIAKVEIRHESSLDIRDFVYERRTDVLTFDYSDELEMIMDLCSKAIQPVLSNLCQFNAYWSKDPMQLTAYNLTQSRNRWMSSAGQNVSFAIKGMLNRIFAVLASLAHSISLLKFHGIGPFYHNMVAFRSKHSGGGDKGHKYEKMIIDSEPFKQMMTRMQFWVNNSTFLGHPKLEELQNLVLTHFLNVGEDTPSRVMVFAAFRDSAEEIVRVLKRNSPQVRPHIFVGQAASKGSEGMDQKTQMDILEKFKAGTHNVLVATSIGEEGLDIGQVDLIVCYDSSASPIRMLQRMGRTGRKRAGRIILLLMRGKEEDSFKTAKDAYEKIQGMIEDGRRFKFHDDLSPRILPREVKPVPEKRRVEIPAENSQALEEPRKGRGKPIKRAAKNLYMPDDVQLGFVSAAGIGPDGQPLANKGRGRAAAKKKAPAGEALDIAPPAEDVFLSSAELRQLDQKYRNVHVGGGGESNGVEIGAPAVTLHAVSQRQLRPTAHVGHGQASRRFAGTMARMHEVDSDKLKVWKSRAASLDLEKLCGYIDLPETTDSGVTGTTKKARAKPKARGTAKARTSPKLRAPAKTRLPAKQSSKRAKTKGGATSILDSGSDSEGMEAASSSPAPTPLGMGLPTQGEDLGSEDTEGEDEDDGEMESELADWIVGSDEEIEVEPSSAATFAGADQDRRSRTKVSNLFTSDDHDEADASGPLPNGAGGADRAAKRRRRRLVVEDEDEEDSPGD